VTWMMGEWHVVSVCRGSSGRDVWTTWLDTPSGVRSNGGITGLILSYLKSNGTIRGTAERPPLGKWENHWTYFLG
jgi:hypothetical protein